MDEDFHKQRTLPDLSEKRSFSLPKKIGPYEIDSYLSRGGMSLVFLGVHPKTREPIVVKVLLPKYVKKKEMLSRFLKEAKIIGMSHHPNIVKLYGSGEWEKGLYIAMEFVQGVSLKQFIQKGALNPKRSLEIILQVAYALCHLHSYGVIHRDLKPENILMTESGDIKVIDFGISQLVEETPYPMFEKPKLMGTPFYMSPEQRENQPLSYASDIYSIGILTYELFLGRLSYGVIRLELLPKAMRKIVERTLCTDPKDRYPDIVDLITDISHYLKQLAENGEESLKQGPEELYDTLQSCRLLLIPKRTFPGTFPETGLAIQEHASLGSPYFDFYPFSETCIATVLAESTHPDLLSLQHLSIFRGMFRMAARLCFADGKKEPHLIPLLQTLNRLLVEEALPCLHLSLLLLNAETHQLFFISCDGSSLCHISASGEVRFLSTPNLALGTQAHPNFLETADNWEIGDTLLLFSKDLKLLQEPQTLQALIEKTYLLPPQYFAEALLKKEQTLSDTGSKKTQLISCIRRHS